MIKDEADGRYNDKKVYVIDVSQSVEHDHPRSLEFLRMDIKNVTDFFRKKGVTTLQERTAFEFITAENASVDPNEMDVQIENLIQQDQAHPVTEEVDERVFRQAYIPKSLFEVVDPERDTGIVHQGGKDDLIYAKFLDVQGAKSQTAETVPIAHQKDKTEEPSNESIGDQTMNEESDSSDESDEDESTSEDETATPRGKRHEDKDAKKVCPK
jgi:RIO kinase 1